jgi:hypothetical protein
LSITLANRGGSGDGDHEEGNRGVKAGLLEEAPDTSSVKGTHLLQQIKTKSDN